MRELFRLPAVVEDLVILSIALRIEREVEPMQMHRVTQIRSVDQLPVNLIADAQVQPFGIGPGLPVYRSAGRTVPALEHENPVILGRKWIIHHEGRSEQSIQPPG